MLHKSVVFALITFELKAWNGVSSGKDIIPGNRELIPAERKYW